MVRFDQCAYKLQFPDSLPHQFVLKRTVIMTNMAELRTLEARCPGKSAAHEHVHAQGTVRWKGRTHRRSALAGHYPQELCDRWADGVACCFSRCCSAHACESRVYALPRHAWRAEDSADLTDSGLIMFWMSLCLGLPVAIQMLLGVITQQCAINSFANS